MAILASPMHSGLHYSFLDKQLSRSNRVSATAPTAVAIPVGAATHVAPKLSHAAENPSVSNAGLTINGTPSHLHQLQDPELQQVRQQLLLQESELEPEVDEPYQTLFCRALYDYESQDNSALSFQRGDIIEVLSQQPSGWWDGLLGDDRGWFPSNYVLVISEEEAEQTFATVVSEATNQSVVAAAAPLITAGVIAMRSHSNEVAPGIDGSGVAAVTEAIPTVNMQFARLQNTQQQLPQDQQHYQHDIDTAVDLSHALMRGGMGHVEGEQWLSNGERRYGSVNGHAGSTLSLSSQSSDFWMPQVTADNQIYYLNTQTGQQSRDLPQEGEEEAAEGELAGFASQSSSRSETSSGLPYRNSHSMTPSSSNEQNIAGFDSFLRTGTPEPWMRRLADDGHTYYYFNKIDGSVQWTRPEPPIGTVRDRGASISRQPMVPVPLLRTSSSRQFTQLESGSQLSVYSDDSDVQPLDHAHRRQPRINSANKTGESPGIPTATGMLVNQTSAERIAKSLQHALAPPPPEFITDLSAAAKYAIQAVVDNIRPNDLSRRSEDDQRMDELIHSVVIAVRNLLYVSAIQTGQVSSSVLPRGYRMSKPPNSQSPLKPAQRKVTATLSRLVLSARAMQYDSGIMLDDTITRIQSDAEELEKAVLSFVLEVQRTQHTADARPLKRLRGVFSTVNIGLGLIGAGATANWKGFGWVSLGDEQSLPKRVFSPDVMAELTSLISRLDEKTTSFSYALRVLDEGSADQIHVRGQDLIAELSTLLTSISDIHLARHVDVDGVLVDGTFSSNEVYTGAVEKARLLVRTLETCMQATHDDGMTLLMTTQTISASEFGQSRSDKTATYERLDGLCLSLKANMDLVQQTLEALLSVGHEQAETAQGEYNGSIEWRMSKVSMIHEQSLPPLEMSSVDNEDVVDMEYAMKRQNNAILPRALASQPEASLNQFNQGIPAPQLSELADDSHSTDNSIDPKDRMPLEPGVDDDVLGVAKSPPRQNAGNSKLAKIFGDEYADKVAKDSQPWYLRPNHDSNEILIDPDGTIRGGSLAALVERLTAHDQLDPTYTKSFLMTYKSFTTVDELFDLLVARFRIQAPSNLAPQEWEEWAKLKQRLIQIRVLNTFKSMVTDEDVLDKEEMFILDRMLEFVKSDEVSHLNAALQLRVNIERAKSGSDALKQTTQTNMGAPPAPIIPRFNKKLKLLDIEPLELARQLSIKECELYRKIRPMECLQRAREQKSENLDNIAVVIQTSNRIADWVAESILSKEDSRKRANVVKHLISVADRCRTLNNFSTMIAITSGLNTPPIRRLKRTWEQVNQRTLAQFAACEATIDSKGNFKEYRRVMQTVTPPCVPFIGVFLSTLQFIQDGNPDNSPGGLVNFRKRQMASEVISDIKRWQAQPFNLVVVPSVMNYIEESLNQFNDTRASGDRFWQMSLEREPREREDEKMARLLQESGFL
ncbi:hypothetical protein AX17_005300 [Amanita inopinata Kibby_2008]|nr:hypothetical protein AX17_005300 [Amanita inopinata Kibby_2008]